jgi:pyridoxal phosphate enzyme (YggS family)
MTDNLHPLATRLQTVRQRIDAAIARHGREPGSVTLLAVSKTRSSGELRALASAGVSRFGENYLQEALEKIDALQDLALEWHFIGPIQSNKTRPIAEHFDWVHSVDRLKLARRLGEQRPTHLPPLNICLQVNVSGEQSKSGVSLEELPVLAREVATLPQLRLRGLMAIPAPAEGLAAQRQPFRLMRQALEQLNAEGLGLDTLSMGMSDDLEAAIAEGATLVRIGTALFGPRPPKDAAAMQ